MMDVFGLLNFSDSWTGGLDKRAFKGGGGGRGFAP